MSILSRFSYRRRREGLKGLLSPLCPDARFHSAYELPYEEMYRRGYRGLIYDIDNTLVDHGAPANEGAIALFERLHRIGFVTMLISNNNEERVAPFAGLCHTDYLHKAHKPMPGGYASCLERMGTTRENTLFIGDQIFTDVLGGKLAGIRTILTSPLNPKEEFQIVLKRVPERFILSSYEKKRSALKERRSNANDHG